jgi:DNA-binding transcriptional LysR family regulator
MCDGLIIECSFFLEKALQIELYVPIMEHTNSIGIHMRPSLDDLYLFNEIAHSGGLIRGAKRLGIPKSTVSRRLAQLEQDVGAKLIDRNTRHFALTETGQAYAERAQRMVEAYADAQDYLAQHDAKPRGILKVAMPADFAIFFLADAISGFTQAYPKVTLDIDASPQLVDIIADRFDLAIRMGKLADSTLIAKPLVTLTRHFYASKTFLKKHGTPASLEALAELPFVSLQTQAPSMSTLSIAMRRGSASFTPRTVIKSNSIGLTHALALAGAGVAVLPDVMAATPLVRLLPAVEPMPADAHIVVSQRQWLPAKTRLFIEHIQAFCAQASSAAPLVPRVR